MKKSFKLSVITLMISKVLLLSGCTESEYQAQSCLLESTGEISSTISCATPDGTAFSADGTINEKDATEVTPIITYQDKGGVSGRVFASSYWANAQVCFDLNRNGLCDEGIEPIEYSDENGQYSFDSSLLASSIANKAPLLALSVQHEDDSEQVSQPLALYAPAPDNSTDHNINISVFTTLTMNEMVFNPTSLSSAEFARAQLLASSLVFGNDELLLGQDYIELADSELSIQANSISASLLLAQELAGSSNYLSHYKATAAVLDNMVQNNSYQVVVTEADIEAQSYLDNKVTASLSATAIFWGLAHDDESSVDVHVQQNLAVVASKYHNRLIVLDMSEDKPETLSLNLFAGSPTERYDIDAFTGASEQSVNQLLVTPDALNVLVSVEKYSGDSSELGVGLYRADLSNPHLITDKRFAEDSKNTTDFFSFAGLNHSAISYDGTYIALSGEDKQAKVLNVADFSVVQTVTFDSKVRAVALDNLGNTLFASLYGSRVGVAIVDINTGAELGFFATGSVYPRSYNVLADGNTIAWYLRDSKVLSIYDISTRAQPVLKKSWAVVKSIKDFKISADGTLAAIAMVDGRLELYAIEGEAKLIDVYQTEVDSDSLVNKPINSIAFVDNNKLVISIKNGVQVLDISSVTDEIDVQTWFELHRKP
ncbi:hypothetical protein CMT41_11480 [Colwellia sp. MT41]|uniref:WD40 repeat domain-containing protein n=1 Tax=Colwellia sp. MT41 TaxID=58049 RepID=UPI0007178903|nr:WD40 repeat domain-containing protein [Colwellia sp. MT41]ALO35273.1 hypothetical protein CMT41_11480 [Colwellia sp. MT41]